MLFIQMPQKNVESKYLLYQIGWEPHETVASKIPFLSLFKVSISIENLIYIVISAPCTEK